jgi:hypothetical protein
MSGEILYKRLVLALALSALICVVNSNFKKCHDPKPSFRHILQKSKYKNRPSKVGFLYSLAQKVTSCGPDGDQNREA